MDKIKIMVLVMFAIVILLPLAVFRTEDEVTSEIDNKKLAKSPWYYWQQGDRNWQKRTRNYFNERIGFRDEMIQSYTLLNDYLFGELLHPAYRYGQNGWIFTNRMDTPMYNEYHKSFVSMVKSVADYCEVRGVPFLLVLEPQKQDVYSEYLPIGVNYDNSWATELRADLDKLGIRYVDNTDTLIREKQRGEEVYNPKYDAVHWNDVGAFYGCNAILSELNKTFPEIKTNQPEQFGWGEVLKTSLLVSKFPIDEMVPKVSVPLDSVENLTNKYKDELKLDKNYHSFTYNVNAIHENDLPRVLVFQGSHMNDKGGKYLAYALGEYIAVHNYQNIIDFPYYFNIFKPQCVIFEVAEGVLIADRYFDKSHMDKINYNPPLKGILQESSSRKMAETMSTNLSVERGEALTTIIWTDDISADYVWLLLDEEYDMHRNTDGSYEVTLKTEDWDRRGDKAVIAALKDNTVTYYGKV